MSMAMLYVKKKIISLVERCWVLLFIQQYRVNDIIIDGDIFVLRKFGNVIIESNLLFLNIDFSKHERKFKLLFNILMNCNYVNY